MSETAQQERTRGRGGSGWAPMTHSSSRDRDDDRFWLEREVELLRRAVADRGDLPRGQLADAVGARYWGPGRFGRALREAVRRRAVGKRGRGRYGPA
jgi:hypothetical protein